MLIVDIICIATLSGFIVLPILALLLSMLQKPNLGADGKEVLGSGPICDICGEYLSEHNFYECEKYC